MLIKIKKILILLLISPLLFGFLGMGHKEKVDPEYEQITDDPVIEQAIKCMDGTTAVWSKRAIFGENITNKPIKVSFYDLEKVSKAYKNNDALGWMKKDKTLQIYINEKHKEAPPEAIASVLAHEALHQDAFNSLEEETFAWTYEADVWHQMKVRNPALKEVNVDEFPLVKRENILEFNLIRGAYTSKYIRQMVYSNGNYRSLKKYSPGFDAKTIYNATVKKYTKSSPYQEDQTFRPRL